MERKTEKRALQSQKALVLKKHVAIIHSSNKLTLLQRKIANALLFNAYANMQEKDEHTIHIAKLCELIGFDSNDHKSIKKALVNLLSTVLEWNLVDGERLDTEGVAWNASSIIADAGIDGAICTYSYSNKMRKLLYRPHMYGRLDMNVQAKFQSGYGLALYENCNRFQDVGRTPWFDLKKFRKLMGVDDDKYKIFRDFKTRVLDKAVEEVNKYSSLRISPQIRKQNRQVTSIQFLIEKQITLETNAVIKDNSGDPSMLSDILHSVYGLSAKQVKDVITQYEEKYIQEKVNLIESSASFKTGKVKNLAKYLLSALHEDYQPTKKSAIVNGDHALPEFSQKIQKCDDELEKRTEFQHYQDKQLIRLFIEQPEKNRSSVLKKFEGFLTGMYEYVYSRSGLENLLVQEQLCVFLRQQNHKLISQLPTYDTWLQSTCSVLPASMRA